MPEPIKLTWEQIQAWIKENTDDKGLIAYLLDTNQTWIKSDKGTEFLLSENGKALYKSETDRVASKAIDTFKEKTMPGLIKTETDKLRDELNPQETPEQKLIREQGDRLRTLENQGKHDRLSKVAIQLFSSLKFNSLSNLSDLFIGDDEEATKSNIKMLETGILEIVDTQVKEKLKGREIPPKNKESDPDFRDPFSDEHWNVTEQMLLFKENRELYDTLRKKAVERGTKLKV